MAESKPVVSKVELPSKKGVIRIEVGETSQGRDQLVISVDGEAQTQSGLSREERVKKFKEENQVIFLIRDHEQFVKYYEPRVVSLGPIHHGKENYQLAETFKSQLANEFFKSSDKTIEEICEVVDGEIKELRKCFEEEVTKKYNDVDLAWILVVDGCAILQYIDLAIKGKFKDLDIKHDSVAFCQQDLFLLPLEDQVPYSLLELLMGLSKVGNELRKSVEEFIKKNHQMPPEDPTHLLHLLRSSLLGPEKQSDNAKETRKIEGNPTYRNVQELKAAGIHVKRGKNNSLRGISFYRNFKLYPGFLSLPPLIVDD
ncbi:hypothetical protein I3843_10G037200 [Carya illinoinensis]|nr:hypothetical protein I3843_10G037200 [Carya illinoinensis]